MTQNVYSIKDAKAGTYGNPFYAINDGVATRSFEQAASDPQTTIHANPEDFNLYKIGTFDDNEGIITSEAQPQFITGAIAKSQVTEESEESIRKYL